MSFEHLSHLFNDSRYCCTLLPIITVTLNIGSAFASLFDICIPQTNKINVGFYVNRTGFT